MVILVCILIYITTIMVMINASITVNGIVNIIIIATTIIATIVTYPYCNLINIVDIHYQYHVIR